MDWKDQLGTYFTENKIYRLEDQHKKLESMVKEWTTYLRQFEKSEADYTKEFTEHHSPYFNMVVFPRTKEREFPPFRMEVGYSVIEDGGLGLELKYAVNAKPDFNANTHKSEADNYIFQYEVEHLFEPEIFEPDYVIQLFNNRLISWMEKAKAQWS